MNETAIMQLVAVVIGGLLATGGGILTTLLVENQKRKHESAQLAMAFKGEIKALLQQIEERAYLSRISAILTQMQETGQPFFMPLRLQFRYDRVYENNVGRIGLLKDPLPERIPIFYTRMNSILEDFLNLAEGTYTALDLPTIQRIYMDLHRLVEHSIADGSEIIQAIDALYPKE